MSQRAGLCQPGSRPHTKPRPLRRGSPRQSIPRANRGDTPRLAPMGIASATQFEESWNIKTTPDPVYGDLRLERIRLGVAAEESLQKRSSLR